MVPCIQILQNCNIFLNKRSKSGKRTRMMVASLLVGGYIPKCGQTHTWMLRVFKPPAAPRWPATRPSTTHQHPRQYSPTRVQISTIFHILFEQHFTGVRFFFPKQLHSTRSHAPISISNLWVSPNFGEHHTATNLHLVIVQRLQNVVKSPRYAVLGIVHCVFPAVQSSRHFALVRLERHFSCCRNLNHIPFHIFQFFLCLGYFWQVFRLRTNRRKDLSGPILRHRGTNWQKIHEK